MNLSFNDYLAGSHGKLSKPTMCYDAVWIASDLLLFTDFLCILVATIIGTAMDRQGWLTGQPVHGLDRYFAQVGLMAAVLAPFMLHDRRFGWVASRGRLSVLLGKHMVRFMMFAAVVLLLGSIGQLMTHVRPVWLFVWLLTNLLMTTLVRLLAARHIRYLQREGVLTEVVAVVGAGPVADRLLQALHQTRAESIRILGIFDDQVMSRVPSVNPSVGTLEKLIELGKTRQIDWIVLTLPPTAVNRLQELVQRLKALSVPIGLCPQHLGLALPHGSSSYTEDGMPMNLLPDRPGKHSNWLRKTGEGLLPRWIVTLAVLPVAAVEAFAVARARLNPHEPQRNRDKLLLEFDNYDLDQFTQAAADFGQTSYGYVVTPNADHVIRLHEDRFFRSLYAAADYILLDSRFLSHVLRLSRGVRLAVCTGSDLTEKLLKHVIGPYDPLISGLYKIIYHKTKPSIFMV